MKKNYLKLCAAVFALALVATTFNGCSAFKKKRVVAVIRPAAEELQEKYLKLEQDVKDAVDQYNADKNGSLPSNIAHMRDYGIVTVGDVQNFCNEVEDVISSRKDLRIIDRLRVEDILKEHEFSLSSLSGTDKAMEVGKALNCDTFVFLSIDDPFPKDGRNYVTQTICVEFLDLNTFVKKVVLVKKNADKQSMWRKSKKALRKLDLDF